MDFIDTHCHLYWADFSNDLPDVFQRARAAGVRRFIIPATDLNTFEAAAEIAATEPDVWITAGVHPHDAANVGDDIIEHLRQAARHPKVVAIGEIGLDYYYDFATPQVQQQLLHAELELAKELDLPVIIHNRDSDEDLIAIVKEHQNGTLRGQFHCFSSSAAYATRVLDTGFHISFTGNVTYKKSTLDPVLSLIPDNRLLMETDAPFMAPGKLRGKRNEPSYIPQIAEYFAWMRHQTVQHIATITTTNAERLFRLDTRGATRDH
ncbi:MAG: TatD family hydrolase [Bacteroidia bacterium]|nr:TatD family hydrolase [Bacteroidia bacterium]